MYEYRVYLTEDKEVFEFGISGQRMTKKALPIGQSILDFYYLEMEEGEAFSEQQLKKFAKECVFLQLSLSQLQDGQFSEKDLTGFPAMYHALRQKMKPYLYIALNGREPLPPVQLLKKFYSNDEFDDMLELTPLRIQHQYLPKENPPLFAPVLLAESLNDILVFLLQSYITRGVTFKLCRNCVRFFPNTGHGNAEYCERMDWGNPDKTCRDIGAVKAYREKAKNDPISVAYNRAYKTHYARIKYKKMTREEFQAWGEEAKGFRDDVILGRKTLEEFVLWAKD